MLVFIISSVKRSSACRYPRWPQEFKWSFAGPISGMTCERILETADPHTWHDNFFCHSSGPGIQGVGMRWSSAGIFKSLVLKKMTSLK